MIRRFELTDGALIPAESEQAPIQLYVNPDAAEREALGTLFDLDEHTLSSALDPDEVSRIETEPGRILLIWKRPTNYSGKDTFFFNVASIGMLLLEGRLVVIVSDNVPLTTGTRHAATLNRPLDVMLGLLLITIQHYLEHLKVINMIADEIETKITHSMENRHLLNLFTLEKSLVYYLNAINSNAVVIDRIRNHAEKLGLSTENRELIDDISIENTQCYRQAEIYSNILASMMDARVSIVSNNLNVLMKTLNIITIAIMVPTFVVSAFSMNVRIPMSGLHNAFYMVISLALLSVIGFYFFWKWKKW